MFLTSKNNDICPLCKKNKPQFDGSCLSCKKEFIKQSEAHLSSDNQDNNNQNQANQTK